MQGKQRRPQWALTWLVLALAVLAFAQMTRGDEDARQQPGERVQVTQTLTIAVCGETCDCGSASLVAKENGPCTVNSATGSCTNGSGECCVCAAPMTLAICGEEMCDCGNALLLTQVPGPCTVTSSAGRCSVGSGQCCVCVPN